MVETAMDKAAYRQALPGIDRDKELFPEEEDNFLDLLHNQFGLFRNSGNSWRK